MLVINPLIEVLLLVLYLIYKFGFSGSSGGSDNDGTLTILGENLEVEKNNQKYRAENTLTKMRSIFGAANYLGGQWPDECTTVDRNENDNELKRKCNNRF